MRRMETCETIFGSITQCIMKVKVYYIKNSRRRWRIKALSHLHIRWLAEWTIWLHSRYLTGFIERDIPVDTWLSVWVLLSRWTAQCSIINWSSWNCFYRMARLCHSMSSVCLSVCLIYNSIVPFSLCVSVTFRYRDHIGQKNLKIILWHFNFILLLILSISCTSDNIC